MRRRKPRVWLTDETIDRVLTHPVLGIPVMAALFAVVFWITVVGANVPSAFLAGLLMTDGGLTEPFKEYLGIEAPAWLASSVYQLLHALFAAAAGTVLVERLHRGRCLPRARLGRLGDAAAHGDLLSRCSRCSKISVICRVSRSISTGYSSGQARTESRR